MTKRSDIPKEIKIPPRKPKAPPKPWRDVPFEEWLDTIRSQKTYKLTPLKGKGKGKGKQKKKRGGKIMVGYKAGGKV